MMSTEHPIRLMAHLIAGFPDSDRDFDIATGLAAAGAEFLEVQFPYSDPAADGPVIQEACDTSITNGFTVDSGFALVEKIHRHLVDTEQTGARFKKRVFIMSYAGLVYARGVERFVDDSVAAGATGLIVPDLMPGYDEGLYEIARKRGIAVVPVLAPSVTDERLEAILALDSTYLYAAIRTGITGKRSNIDGTVAHFLKSLRRSETTLIAGFGVSSHEQAAELQNHADMLVVGTAFVTAALEAAHNDGDVRTAVMHRVSEIIE